MRAIIENKLYDTENSEKIMEFRRRVDKGPIAFLEGTNWMPFHQHVLYRTAKGNFFLHDTEDDNLSKIEEQEAAEIVKRLDVDKYVELWGEVELA